MRVTTEENVKEVLAQIEKEIKVWRRKERTSAIVIKNLCKGRRLGLEAARMIIVAHLNFE